MNPVDLILTPFLDYAFMRQALVAGLMLVISAAPVGVLLFYRRMSLMGDALQHAILPGVAAGYFLFGLSLWPMMFGGLLAGFCVALVAGAISRTTRLKEDGSFAALYLIALALGVLLISLRRNPLDLMHLLFGNILALTPDIFTMLLCVMAITLFALALFYRAVVIEAVDSTFLTVMGKNAGFYHLLFIGLAVLNLVAGFQAMGALMALGLMIIPAASAGFWKRNIDGVIAVSMAIGSLSLLMGLLFSYYLDWPSGPAIILVAGGIYIFSVGFGKFNSLRAKFFPSPHLVE